MPIQTLAAILLAPVTLAAPIAPAQPRDATAQVERLADGVYAILHDDATDEWPHGNTGVIVTAEGVVVVDSCYLPSRARADIALIRQITDQPVRYLLNTHWHFDHNNGAVAYRDAFPGLAYVAERESAGWIELNQTWWSKMATAPDSAKRKGLADMENQVATGTRSDGKPIAPDELRKMASFAERRNSELLELASLTVVTPNVTFDREFSLVMGGRRIELRDVGRANSPHDVTIYLPDERILFAGDVLVQAPLPFTGASWPVQWASVLRDIESVPVVALVPGHGPVMHDHTYTRQVRALMEAVTSRVASLARRGRTLDQVQAEIDLEDLRQSVPAWSPKDQQADWKIVIAALVERAWRGLRGQG
jgi:cyclase